jgi:CubicO group peptidase (beta-lactamase class C family)
MMQIVKTFFFCAIFIIMFQNVCFGQDINYKLDKIITNHAESGHLNGALLVAENGNIIYSKAFGLANLEWSIPNDINTKFRIYSMSKQFTALLIMQLVETGKIDLHKAISEYLPYYRKDVGSKVTIHHVLTHTHGIAEEYDRLPPFLVTEPTQQLILKYFSNDFDFQPGSQFRYSGLLGYILLGAIIESVTGKSYEDVLQEKILDPVGMKNSTYLNYKKIIKMRASDYSMTKNGLEHRIQAYPINADGASCLVSTVNDLLLWDQALYTDKLISEKYRNLIFTPHVTQHAPYYYGYGWYIADLVIAGDNKRVYYHTGGGTCIIFRSHTDNQTVITLNNLRSNILYDIGLEILTHFEPRS